LNARILTRKIMEPVRREELALGKDIEAGMQEMEALSDLAMIAWVSKKERMKAKQESKQFVAEEKRWGAVRRINNGLRREFKRCQSGPSVKDAVKMMKMEVGIEVLAKVKAQAERKKAQVEAKARLRRNAERRRMMVGPIIFGIRIEMGWEEEQEKAPEEKKAKFKARPKPEKMRKPKTKAQKNKKKN